MLTDNQNAPLVLLVEDEKDLSKTIAFRLEANGYTVITSYDGQDGFEKAKREEKNGKKKQNLIWNLLNINYMLKEM